MLKNILIIVLVLGTCVSSGAQNFKDILNPNLFSSEVGGTIAYMPSNTFIVKGYDFSNQGRWKTNLYLTYKLPFVDLTYTQIPDPLFVTDGAILSSNTHRLDFELKLNYPVKPLLVAEWKALELNTCKIKEDLTGQNLPFIINETEEINNIYGGLGLTFETSLSIYLDLKSSVACRFINELGWEATVGLCYMPYPLYKGKPHIMAGIVAHDSHYSWGRSKSFGFITEFGMTF